MAAYCKITIEVIDAGKDVVLEDEDAKLILDAANIGLETIPEDVVDADWASRLWYEIVTVQTRIKKVQ